MSDVPGLDTDPPEDERDPDEPDESTDERDTSERDDSGAADGELAKWKRRAEARETRLRAAQAELARLRAEKDGSDKDEPNATEVANRRLVGAEVRAQLAAMGITERDEQRAVLAVLDLSGVEVDADGEVDSEAVEEKIDALRRAFGVNGAAPAPKRSPRVDTRDKAPKDSAPADPDTQRYRRILGTRPSGRR